MLKHFSQTKHPQERARPENLKSTLGFDISVEIIPRLTSMSVFSLNDQIE